MVIATWWFTHWFSISLLWGFSSKRQQFTFRRIPEGGYEAKQKGKPPYLLTNTPNKLVDAFLEGKIITKEEYENY